jgi:hypothetical protein
MLIIEFQTISAISGVKQVPIIVNRLYKLMISIDGSSY